MVYKWYFSCQLGDGLCHRSHLLGEPETTIDFSWWITRHLKLTAISHLKKPGFSKRISKYSGAIHFQVRTVSFREGIFCSLKCPNRNNKKLEWEYFEHIFDFLWMYRHTYVYFKKKKAEEKPWCWSHYFRLLQDACFQGNNKNCAGYPGLEGTSKKHLRVMWAFEFIGAIL